MHRPGAAASVAGVPARVDGSGRSSRVRTRSAAHHAAPSSRPRPRSASATTGASRSSSYQARLVGPTGAPSGSEPSGASSVQRPQRGHRATGRRPPRRPVPPARRARRSAPRPRLRRRPCRSSRRRPPRTAPRSPRSGSAMTPAACRGPAPAAGHAGRPPATARRAPPSRSASRRQTPALSWSSRSSQQHARLVGVQSRRGGRARGSRRRSAGTRGR